MSFFEGGRAERAFRREFGPEETQHMRTNVARHLAIALLALAGCSPVDHVGSKYVKSERVAASQGATITVVDSDEPALAGAALRIEPGALAADTVITLELSTAPLTDSAEQAVGPVAIWGPAGTAFAMPAQMTLPYRLAFGQRAQDLYVQVQEADGRRFALGHGLLTVDEAAQTVRFQVNGFTAFQPAAATACTASSQCPTGSLCVAGACQPCSGGRCPQCGMNADCNPGEVCSSGACVIAALDGGPTCASYRDCPPNHDCVSSTCVASSCGPNLCAQCPAQCTPDFQCTSGGWQCNCDCGGVDAGPIDAGPVDAGPSCGPNPCGACQQGCTPADVCSNGRWLCDCSCPAGADAGTPDAGAVDAGAVDAGPGPCRTNQECTPPQQCINFTCQ